MLYDKKFETMEEAILFAKGLLKYGIEVLHCLWEEMDAPLLQRIKPILLKQFL